MATNSIKSNLDILREIYGDWPVETTADFQYKYGYEASELEQIIYGLEKSDNKTTNSLTDLVFSKNPFLSMLPKDNFQGAVITVPIKIK
jgi:hypothetical protein